MPTLITPALLNLFPLGSQAESVPLSVLSGFLASPVLSRLPNWQLIGASVSFANPADARLTQLQGSVVNLCIDFNIMPYIRSYDQWTRSASPEMNLQMINFMRDYLILFWLGSPSGHIMSLDPRGVNVEWIRVPDARLVAEAMTYVFSYLTPPPGSPSKVVDKTYNQNLTITSNTTQVATLKMANSTSRLDSNITKRAAITCQDFYPNILPFLQGGPMTTVGTNTVSCAA